MIESDKEILTFQLEAENDIQKIMMDTVIVTVVSDTAAPTRPWKRIPQSIKRYSIF